jgi:hypothetical protein
MLNQQLELAADLNNEGVRLLLEENQAVASIQVLRRAIVVIQNCFRTIVSAENSAVPLTAENSAVPLTASSTAASSAETMHSHLEMSPPASSCSPIRECSLPPFLQQCEARIPNLCGKEQYFVYDRPFLIASNWDTLTPCPSPTECSIIVDVIGCHILFNYALVWHQQAKNTGSESSVRQAGLLYENLLHMLNSSGGHRYSLSVAALMCLVCNNRADLHYELCEYKESGVCFDIVLNLLHELHGLEHYLQAPELSRMVWNIAHLEPPSMASAA